MGLDSFGQSWVAARLQNPMRRGKYGKKLWVPGSNRTQMYGYAWNHPRWNAAWKKHYRAKHMYAIGTGAAVSSAKARVFGGRKMPLYRKHFTQKKRWTYGHERGRMRRAWGGVHG